MFAVPYHFVTAQNRAMATTLIPVDVSRDPESGAWRFSIDKPPVVGGGQATKEAALEAAAEALTEVLAPVGEPVKDEPGVMTELLQVTVEPTQ